MCAIRRLWRAFLAGRRAILSTICAVASYVKRFLVLSSWFIACDSFILYRPHGTVVQADKLGPSVELLCLREHHMQGHLADSLLLRVTTQTIDCTSFRFPLSVSVSLCLCAVWILGNDLLSPPCYRFGVLYSATFIPMFRS